MQDEILRKLINNIINNIIIKEVNIDKSCNSKNIVITIEGEYNE